MIPGFHELKSQSSFEYSAELSVKKSSIPSRTPSSKQSGKSMRRKPKPLNIEDEEVVKNIVSKFSVQMPRISEQLFESSYSK